MSKTTLWTDLPEHTRVQVPHPDPAAGIAPGAIGTIVHCYSGGSYEIEFPGEDGKPNVVGFAACDVRPVPKFVCMISLNRPMGEGPRIWYEKFELEKGNTFDAATGATHKFTWKSANHFLNLEDMREQTTEHGFYQTVFETEEAANDWCAGANSMAKVLRTQLDVMLQEV